MLTEILRGRSCHLLDAQGRSPSITDLVFDLGTAYKTCLIRPPLASPPADSSKCPISLVPAILFFWPTEIGVRSFPPLACGWVLILFVDFSADTRQFCDFACHLVSLQPLHVTLLARKEAFQRAQDEIRTELPGLCTDSASSQGHIR